MNEKSGFLHHSRDSTISYWEQLPQDFLQNKKLHNEPVLVDNFFPRGRWTSRTFKTDVAIRFICRRGGCREVWEYKMPWRVIVDKPFANKGSDL